MTDYMSLGPEHTRTFFGADGLPLDRVDCPNCRYPRPVDLVRSDGRSSRIDLGCGHRFTVPVPD